MYQKFTCVGRLGMNPDVRTTESGAKVAMMNIACNERGYKTKDGKEIPERVEWIPIVLWNGLAEVAEKFLKKGNLVLVEGKMRTRSYEKDGMTLYRTEIYADSMQMLESRKDNAPLPPESGSESISPSPAPSFTKREDDLPF